MKTVALLGFMGTGKSTVGKALAARMGLNYIDLDAAIVQRTALDIDDYFAIFGEEAFREVESETLEDYASQEDCVLATGGGIVKNEDNRVILKEHCIRISLTATPEVIAARCEADEGAVRPLLMKRQPWETLAERVEQLLAPRRAYYEEADLVIDTTDATVEEIVDQIVAFLNR